MNQTELFHSILTNLSRHHQIVSEKLVKGAYMYACDKHANAKRKTGESYIMHPLRVANYISEWGFNDAVVAAALLHDVIEDCNITEDDLGSLFSPEIAKWVNYVSKVREDEISISGLSKEEIDNLTDAKLLRSMSTEAFFIKMGDRLDNLKTIEGMPPQKQVEKAIHTRELIIPLAIKNKAYEIARELTELCFKIENSDKYNVISKKYHILLNENNYRVNNTLHLFQEVFSESFIAANESLSAFTSYVSGLQYRKRYIYDIYKDIQAKIETYPDLFDLGSKKLFNKENIPLYDMVLITKEFSRDNPIIMDLFYGVYEKFLLNNHYYMLSYNKYGFGFGYIIICDDFDNRYRFFIMSKDEYNQYKFGKHGSIDLGDLLPLINDSNVGDSLSPKIRVFSRSNQPFYMPPGSTVLDFAFAIHSDIGLRFKCAYIDDNFDVKLPAKTLLKEGDKISIDFNNEAETVTLKSFLNVTTHRAKVKLIEYFSKEIKS